MPNRAQRRATPAPKYWTLPDWKHARTVQVDLDGKLVDFELPDLHVYMALGKVPEPLIALARTLFTTGISEADLSDEEILDYVMLQCHVIAGHLRRPDVRKENGGDMTKAAEWVKDNMPPLHRLVLWQRSVNHVDMAALMATFQNAGESPEPVGEEPAAGEVAESTA